MYPYLAEDCTYIISSGGGVNKDGEEVITDVVGRRDIEFVLRSSAAFSATAGSIIVECRDDFDIAHDDNNDNDGDDDDDDDDDDVGGVLPTILTAKITAYTLRNSNSDAIHSRFYTWTSRMDSSLRGA